MEKNTQLPVEVVEKIKQEGQEMLVYAPDNKYSYIKGATAYASKLQEVQQENASLKDWKHSALAILNPLWDYADKHLNVPLGEIKTEAMIKRIKELEHQNDKLKEKATDWRPLLEETLSEWDSMVFEMQLKDKITKFLYGE